MLSYTLDELKDLGYHISWKGENNASIYLKGDHVIDIYRWNRRDPWRKRFNFVVNLEDIVGN